MSQYRFSHSLSLLLHPTYPSSSLKGVIPLMPEGRNIVENITIDEAISTVIFSELDSNGKVISISRQLQPISQSDSHFKKEA